MFYVLEKTYFAMGVEQFWLQLNSMYSTRFSTVWLRYLHSSASPHCRSFLALIQTHTKEEFLPQPEA